MTSEERREKRYRRRKAKREEKRKMRSRACGCFEEIFSYKNLFESAKKCCRGVDWKNSTQKYRFNIATNVAKTRRELLNGTYKGKGFTEFDLIERGKKRHIKSVHISERVVQRTLCDKALVPTFTSAMIYDNGASMKGKGISFAVRRVERHLRQHYRKHGNEGYVLTFDFSRYFDNANHEPIQAELERRIHDVDVRKLANQCLEAFGPVGYGLGSQISQIAAIMLPNKLDHIIKQELGIKGYARYMDDGYLIHHSKAHLKHCLERIKEVCDELGIILNPKKTKISMLKHGFKFLKINFKLTNAGKIVERMSKESVRTMKRKLEKFKRWNENGREVVINGSKITKKFPLADICAAYASWRSHMLKGNNYYRVKRTDGYFEKLFGVNPGNRISWKMMINGGRANV